jgi:hypothetical protein
MATCTYQIRGRRARLCGRPIAEDKSICWEHQPKAQQKRSERGAEYMRVHRDNNREDYNTYHRRYKQNAKLKKQAVPHQMEIVTSPPSQAVTLPDEQPFSLVGM